MNCMDVCYVLIKAFRKIFNRCAVKNSALDKTARADTGSSIAFSSMGRYSYIGEHTSLLYAHVGNFTSISNYCAIGGGSHPVDWVSTSPVFNSSASILRANLGDCQYNPFCETNIGNDVWIGSHCLIKAGVTIGDGAVVGMGSVVTKDVGPYEIWAGNPAKLIRKRFDNETIEKLLEVKWWDLPDDELRSYAPYFNDPSAFLQKLTK